MFPRSRCIGAIDSITIMLRTTVVITITGCTIIDWREKVIGDDRPDRGDVAPIPLRLLAANGNSRRQ
jgi:hypothetical protein